MTAQIYTSNDPLATARVVGSEPGYREQFRLELARDLIRAKGASAVEFPSEIVTALREISEAVFSGE